MSDRVTFRITFPFELVKDAIAAGRLRLVDEDGEPLRGSVYELTCAYREAMADRKNHKEQ